MRKRVLSLLLAASAAFCFIFSSAPEAQAIVPIGLVQSALASYVASTGYKMWSDNGGGELMVEALSTLYQSWLDSTDPVAALTLGQMSENDYVYLDNSGQIVIRKAAADLFQQFADWIQTEYSVPVGSDTPTSVLQPQTGGELITSDVTITGVTYPIKVSSGVQTINTLVKNLNSDSLTYWTSISSVPVVCATFYEVGAGTTMVFASKQSFYSKAESSGSAFPAPTNPTYSPRASSYNGQTFYFDGLVTSSEFIESTAPGNVVTNLSSLDRVKVAYVMLYGDVSSSAGVAGLGVTLAQAVADVVGQAKEDDAVVIGVGASAGATAQDIADMVAQGIKAQTLNPSVSITAEAVIDTPVQPYPDIDGLGLPTLGAALVDRFPFCIPWDFVDTVRLLSADPQPINIKVDLIPQRIKTAVGISSDTSFDIDLSGEQYAKIGVFCRWGSLIGFCFGLFLLTKRLVWTA